MYDVQCAACRFRLLRTEGEGLLLQWPKGLAVVLAGKESNARIA